MTALRTARGVSVAVDEGERIAAQQPGPGCMIAPAPVPPDMLALAEADPTSSDWRHLLHIERTAGGEVRTLILVSQLTRYDLEEAHACHFSIRRWRQMSVGIAGSLAARIADQQAIGRKRRDGERSPVPLPDWYDLSHVAYQHSAETGFDPKRDLWMFMPADHHPYVNFAEALHVRQPA